MILAQGRFWRAALSKDSVALEIQRASLPEDLYELRELRIEVPLARWNRVVKNVHSDRKLLGGVLLDFAKHKERVSAVVGNDRLLAEFRHMVLDATMTLVEEEIIVLSIAEGSGED